MWTKAGISRLMPAEMRFLRGTEGKTETEINEIIWTHFKYE
jgi:hypothetical protein